MDIGKLLPQQCCLFVIDPQERLMAHIHEAARVSRNIGLMIRLATVLNIPVLACTQYKKGIGPFVPELAPLLADCPCADKTEFNAVANPGTKRLLSELPASVHTLLLCGVESHICVWQTAVGAIQEGYEVQVVADAISSRTPENHAYGQQRLREIGVVLAPAEMIIYDFLQKAGTPAFKAMVPYLK
ncbi:isochorismatase family protein [Candidatus Electronema sp. PJ]|uniref:isochorismatase family protein n=1 Tax=Candidatus Electronema sp. PJ TaxID=3401572 RepID=UPI003AA9A6AD